MMTLTLEETPERLILELYLALCLKVWKEPKLRREKLFFKRLVSGERL
jgi:hypothetical protein